MSVRVRIAPYSVSEYTSLVYAGLYELQAAGVIELVLDASLLGQTEGRSMHFATALLQVEDSKSAKSRRLAFDFNDGCQLLSPELLSTADTYFKRSYRMSTINQLPETERTRVRPFGLHYACTSPTQSLRQRWQLLREYQRSVLPSTKSYKKSSALRSSAKSTLSLAFAKYWKSNCPSNLPPLIKELECEPTDATQSVIFYRTRVYGPTSVNAELGAAENENRVAVIRALKREFGNRFVGGLRATEFAKKNFSDCVFEDDLNWRKHIGVMKRNLIGVTTAGLFDSTDWKLAEYLAAARCTVAEQLRYELPHPLQDGREFLSFDTPDECVGACDRILTDSTLAESLRQNAHSYYNAHLAPAQLMRTALGV